MITEIRNWFWKPTKKLVPFEKSTPETRTKVAYEQGGTLHGPTTPGRLAVEVFFYICAKEAGRTEEATAWLYAMNKEVDRSTYNKQEK